MTMLGRPSSSGGYPSQASQSQMRNNQHSRYTNMSSTGYRGVSGGGPVAPYAFTHTPQLANHNANPRQFAQNSGRSISSPQSQPTSPTSIPQIDLGGRSLSLGLPAIPPTGSLMPISPQLSPPAPSTTPKPSPDRYRRNNGRRADGEGNANRALGSSAVPSGSGMAAVGALYNHPTQSSSTPSLGSQQSYRGPTHGNATPSQLSSADDLALGKTNNTELAARYRRRSFGSIETAGLNHASDVKDTSSPHPNTFLPSPPAQPVGITVQRPPHKHTPSSDSVASSPSTHSSRPNSARGEHRTTVMPVANPSPTASPRSDQRLAARSPRSGDSSIRQPSPLSRPVNLQADEPEKKPNPSPAVMPQQQTNLSPAVEQLAALNQKTAPKSKSKLRRAFSFGSAAELRKVTTQGNHEKSLGTKTANASKRTSKYEDELEPEQARIAEKQEAAGLGESIYSGQGQFFTGSTDNLSISSTASSASVMLRKMGKGVKKGTRSLVGLFRPKSVVGVPAADGPVNQGSLAEVSMVTVEAEREKVNVNVNPHDQVGGGTGFPKLERNSVETKLSFDSGTMSSETRSRRSIVGGEKERAEVLAAVKKGILKRADSNQLSPKPKTYDFKVPDFNLPQIPHVNDSPKSSAPSTPADETPRSGHRRTDSITIETNDHDDYFSSMTRFASAETKETPMTPQGILRNISFSPRLQFYDTWPSGEYDRRGEIATCNRLTPMLAQQIKEELNTFKMEMEVHESSKVYTHFF
ncbi:bud neck involved protein [Exophiala xenobiotica]|nr:bud neck involved protein [Exophiala xenobiotica]